MPIREGIETRSITHRDDPHLCPKGVPIREGIETLYFMTKLFPSPSSEGSAHQRGY